MYQPQQMNSEISYRQKKMRTDYAHAQRQVSVAGLRQILGNTFIELGGRIHGMTQTPCGEAAEARGHVRRILRTSDASIQTTGTH